MNEGARIKLTSGIIGGDYTWTQSPGDALEIPAESNNATITVRVAGDFVPADAATRNTTLTLTVFDPIEGDNVMISRVLTIRRIDNGPARIDFSGSFNNPDAFINDFTHSVKQQKADRYRGR